MVAIVTRVRFGLFEFDVGSGALLRQGVPVRLQPQPARVLALLVRSPGDVVTRETLQQEVWGDGTFVDFERGLNFCIAQIRSALGDSADSPRFIETLPKRGYRFIAPVSIAASGAEAAKAEQPRSVAVAPLVPADLPRTLARPAAVYRWPLIIPLIVLATVTVALVSTAWRALPGDRRVRVAVVPFDNETGMDGLDHVARSVADATVARLATPDRLRFLGVIGNAATLYQPRAFRDLRRIGAELGAEYIVLAQMKSDAAGVRLIAHLIRVPDQVHVWANTYDRSAFTLEAQAEIAESIAGAVARTISTSSSPAARN
jgi:DNA-binding winged helix-turn-helix (wHTH) protein/TolB-like protein